jgi:hypothetical protein
MAPSRLKVTGGSSEASNTEKTAVSTRRPAFSAHFAPLMLLLYTGK